MQIPPSATILLIVLSHLIPDWIYNALLKHCIPIQGMKKVHNLPESEADGIIYALYNLS